MSTSKHILIIDDHDDTLDVLAVAFAQHGYRVSKAKDGREGLDVLVRQHEDAPVLVLLDLDMPIMSGSKFFEVKQLYTRLAAIPVIVMTATAETIDHPTIVRHFRKPIDPLLLVQAATAVTAG